MATWYSARAGAWSLGGDGAEQVMPLVASHRASRSPPVRRACRASPAAVPGRRWRDGPEARKSAGMRLPDDQPLGAKTLCARSACARAACG